MVSVRALGNARLWTAVGLVFIALFSAAPATATATALPYVDHHVSAAGHHDQLAFTDHAHIGASPTYGAPAGDVVASRSRAALVVVGLVLAAAWVWGLGPRHTPLAGRDPPRGPIAVIAGRDVLARLCISRR